MYNLQLTPRGMLKIKTVPEAIRDACVLNYDDELVRKLKHKNVFYSSMNKLNMNNAVYFNDGIYYKDELIVKKEDLPFISNHFIQNILSAVGACISLDLSIDKIASGVKSYKALNRRFTKLNDKPLIYDDFAHNPDGIKATIAETLKLLLPLHTFVSWHFLSDLPDSLPSLCQKYLNDLSLHIFSIPFLNTLQRDAVVDFLQVPESAYDKFL